MLSLCSVGDVYAPYQLNTWGGYALIRYQAAPFVLWVNFRKAVFMDWLIPRFEFFEKDGKLYYLIIIWVEALGIWVGGVIEVQKGAVVQLPLFKSE